MALNRRFQHNQHNLMVCVGQCEDLWYSHTLQDAPLTLFCKHFYDILLLYAGFAAVTTCFTHLHTVLLKTGGERFFSMPYSRTHSLAGFSQPVLYFDILSLLSQELCSAHFPILTPSHVRPNTHLTVICCS